MAKKRKKQARKTKSDPPGSFDKMAEDARSTMPDVESRVLQVNELSERILAVAYTYYCAETNEGLNRFMVLSTLVAWNAALMPEAERHEYFAKFLDGLTPKPNVVDRHLIVEDLKDLVAMHLRLAPDDIRTVLDFEIDDTGETLQLRVASAHFGA